MHGALFLFTRKNKKYPGVQEGLGHPGLKQKAATALCNVSRFLQAL